MSGPVELRCRARRGEFLLDVEARLERPSTGVFGRSGAGKSTLLAALAGLVPAEELRLAVGGDVLVDTARGPVPPAHRRRVGLVFQDHRLFPHRSVEQNLRYGERAGGPRFDDVVDALEIGPLLERAPGACSGGERQRVALGRALLAAPRLLLLDEPLASLDRGLKRQILPYLRRAREAFDVPLLVVGHDLGELLALTDELLLVEGGRVAGQGDVGSLVAAPDALELLHDCGLVFALPGRVSERDASGLAWVELAGPGRRRLACGDCAEPAGAAVEVLLRPEDVVLARSSLEGRTSMTNELAARVEHVHRGHSRVIVALDAGLDGPLLAEVTERAVRALDLAPGRDVTALCKAQATRTRAVGVDER